MENFFLLIMDPGISSQEYFDFISLHDLCVHVDRVHKWRPKKYSFVYVLITSLVSTDKIQKKSSFRMGLVGLISTKTKEY